MKMMKRAMGLSLLFIFIGFIGGAVRYWRWWPSHTTPYFIVSRDSGEKTSTGEARWRRGLSLPNVSVALHSTSGTGEGL